VRLERHVGGLSLARKRAYLQARGWSEAEAAGAWRHPVFGEVPLSKAVHHQLTDDLSQALAARGGWQVAGFSARGYVQLREGADGGKGRTCSLPKALRTQARREGRRVGELTYALFLTALLGAGEPEA
jgi:hypothetical protein